MRKVLLVFGFVVIAVSNRRGGQRLSRILAGNLDL
jgi:hypothetical protein